MHEVLAADGRGGLVAVFALKPREREDVALDGVLRGDLRAGGRLPQRAERVDLNDERGDRCCSGAGLALNL